MKPRQRVQERELAREQELAAERAAQEPGRDLAVAAPEQVVAEKAAEGLVAVGLEAEGLVAVAVAVAEDQEQLQQEREREQEQERELLT